MDFPGSQERVSDETPEERIRARQGAFVGQVPPGFRKPWRAPAHRDCRLVESARADGTDFDTPPARMRRIYARSTIPAMPTTRRAVLKTLAATPLLLRGK